MILSTGGRVNWTQATPWRRLAKALGWTRSSYFLMSGFVATLFVIGVVCQLAADQGRWHALWR